MSVVWTVVRVEGLSAVWTIGSCRNHPQWGSCICHAAEGAQLRALIALPHNRAQTGWLSQWDLQQVTALSSRARPQRFRSTAGCFTCLARITLTQWPLVLHRARRSWTSACMLPLQCKWH